MTRDEWYNSVEFKKIRLFNNSCHNLKFKLQEIYDMLGIVLEGKEDIECLDKFHILNQQLKIVGLEISKLIDVAGDAVRMVEPKIES